MEKVKVPSVCGGWLAGRQSLQNLAPCCASACPLVILSGGFRFLFQLPTSHLFIHPLNLKTRQPALGSRNLCHLEEIYEQWHQGREVL
ncbi:hypothetical protein PVAP13_4NG304900 [Panicum virgatum]|uniref:Uncharacterized protein n=1 Tax=Panicum virgatum TaxID=38727 RepID=A0A8T0TFW6_PANVG|nr:hypothetical protein PVAP13_4NG304900 [Panicum virgatum]